MACLGFNLSGAVLTMEPPPAKKARIESRGTERSAERVACMDEKPFPPPGSILRGTLAIPSAHPDAAAFLEACVLHPTVSASAHDAPAPLRMACEKEGMIHIPRMLGLDRYTVLGEADQRTLGSPLSSQVTKIQLTTTPPQVEAMAAVLAQLRGPLGAAQLVLPCGFGKTIVGIKTAVELGRTTVILVSDRGLQRQWLDRLGTHAPDLKVGVIQGKKADFEGKDVCVCMVQSLFKPNKYPAALFDYFGTVIIDEHHMMAAREFSKVVPHFSARYLLALSATPDRDDGLTQALFWLFGPIAYRCARSFEHVDVRSVRYTGGDESEIFYRWMDKATGKPLLNFPAMVERMIQDPVRNGILVRLTLELVAQGRHGIILTSRREHIETLQAMLLSAKPDVSVGVYHGDLGDEERGNVLRNKFDVFISIVQLGKQALDKPELSFLVLGTPLVNKYEQAVGRILRPYPNKKVPTVVDMVDPYSLFLGMYRKRSKLYKEWRYAVQHTDLAL